MPLFIFFSTSTDPLSIGLTLAGLALSFYSICQGGGGGLSSSSFSSFFNMDFSQMFHDFVGHGMPQHHQQEPSTAIPPASRKFISSLQEACVVSDDLLEESNKECCVCLETQEVGNLAVKLPCGHLYHKRCVVDWLQRHCTCPCCRFEVESNDSSYEEQRRKRMRERKLRMRQDEISGKNIPQLKELCRSLNISIIGCLDKSEIVDRLKASGRIEIVEGAPAPTLSRSAFVGKSVSELRFLLKSYGMTDEGAIEKRELRSRLEESGRIIITEDEDAPPSSSSGGSSSGSSSSSSASSSGGGGGGGDMSSGISSASSGSSSSAASCGNSFGFSTPSSTVPSDKFQLQRSFLLEIPIRELKSILSGYGINAERCVERQNLIDLIERDTRFEILEE